MRITPPTMPMVASTDGSERMPSEMVSAIMIMAACHHVRERYSTSPSSTSPPKGSSRSLPALRSPMEYFLLEGGFSRSGFSVSEARLSGRVTSSEEPICAIGRCGRRFYKIAFNDEHISVRRMKKREGRAQDARWKLCRWSKCRE